MGIDSMYTCRDYLDNNSEQLCFAVFNGKFHLKISLMKILKVLARI